VTALADMRAVLDQLDDELVEVIARRLELCRQIAHVKKDQGVPMMQDARVREVKRRTAARGASRGVEPRFLARLYDCIIDEACRIESEVLDAGSTARSLGSARRIDHVAIAVRDLEAAVQTYRDRFGFELVERRTIEGGWSGMLLAEMRAGGATFVLVQGTSPASNVSRYIDHYGPGVQHLAIEVEGIDAVVEDLGDRGCDLLTGIVRGPGLDQAFTRREPNSGMQVEFVERTDNEGFSGESIRQLFEAMEREDVY
jgi:methylmalonyl-CoA epimerase